MVPWAAVNLAPLAVLGGDGDVKTPGEATPPAAAKFDTLFSDVNCLLPNWEGLWPFWEVRLNTFSADTDCRRNKSNWLLNWMKKS